LAKDDLAFMQDFTEAIERYYEDRALEGELEDEDNYPVMMTQEQAEVIGRELRRARANVQDLRTRLLRDTPRATRIATRVGSHLITVSAPPPINYHLPTVYQNKFQAIFHDSTYGQQVRPENVLDCANETIGLLEEQVESEIKKLKNPLHWIWMLIVFIIRLPYNFVKLSGFDVDKLQDHFFGKFFGVLFQILWIVFLVGLLLYLGVGKEKIAEWIKNLPQLKTS
jgi:hypothetical protein